MNAVWKRRAEQWWLVEEHTGNVLASIARKGKGWEGVTDVEGASLTTCESLQQCMRDCEKQIREAENDAGRTVQAQT